MPESFASGYRLNQGARRSASTISFHCRYAPHSQRPAFPVARHHCGKFSGRYVSDFSDTLSRTCPENTVSDNFAFGFNQYLHRFLRKTRLGKQDGS